MKKDSIISLSALVLMLVFSVPAIAQEQSANKGKLQWLGDFSYFECSSHNGLTPHSVAVDYGLQYGKHFQVLVRAEREHTRLKCADGVKSWLDSANLGGGVAYYSEGSADYASSLRLMVCNSIGSSDWQHTIYQFSMAGYALHFGKSVCPYIETGYRYSKSHSRGLSDCSSWFLALGCNF